MFDAKRHNWAGKQTHSTEHCGLGSQRRDVKITQRACTENERALHEVVVSAIMSTDFSHRVLQQMSSF